LVLSVTPNSPASRLGLVSGDIILEVNNSSLKNSTVSALIEQHYVENNNAVSIKIVRDESIQYLAGELTRLVTPAWALTLDKIEQPQLAISESDSQEHNNACGRIIIGKYMPREDGTPFRARSVFIREVDGVKQRMTATGRGSVVGLYAQSFSLGKTRFKLGIGKHVIKVAPRVFSQEEIEANDFSNIRFGAETEFVINIAANTSYYLVYDTRKNSPYSKTNMPVIWQTKSQACAL
jgi:hypothetical protein